MSKNLKVDIGDLKEEREVRSEKIQGGDAGYRLTIFGGEEALFQDFLEKFIMLSNAYEWDDRTTCRRFPLYLKNLALDYFFELPDNVKGKWEDLKGAFKKKYITPDASKLFGREFRTRIQGPNEKVETYAHNIKKLAKMAYPLFTPQQIDAVLTDQFILGLNRNLKSALWDKEFDTFEGAVNKARSMEYRKELLLSVAPQESLSVTREPERGDNHAQPVLINSRELINNKGDYFCDFCKKYGHLLKSCRKMAEQRNGEFLRNNSTNIECYRCGKKGHRRDQCMAQIREARPQERNTITCYKCGNQGHISRDCRKMETSVRKPNERDNQQGWDARGWSNKNNNMVMAVEDGTLQAKNNNLEMEIKE